MRSDVAVELAVIQINKSILELLRLSLQPVRESITDFINLGVGELDCLTVGDFYVVAILILANRLLDVRHCVVQGVFEKAHAVIYTIITSDTELLPNLHILVTGITGILVH